MKKKDNSKIFVRKGDLFHFVRTAIARYANNINEKCMPAIKDLGLMSSDLKTIIRYCCIGGKERMKMAFIADIPQGTAMHNVAVRQFDYIMQNHPEYEECANTWKWVNCLCIDENGNVVINQKEYEERISVYLTTQQSIDFYESLNTCIDDLNRLFPHHPMVFESPIQKLNQLICWDGNEHKFKLNPNHISDDFIYKFLTKPSGNIFQTMNANEKHLHEQKIKSLREDCINEMKSYGFSDSEIETLLENDETLK